MSKMRDIWICGKYLGKASDGSVWAFQGVFSIEENAVKACKDHRYFVGPATLGEELPDENIEWPGCYYPHILK